MLWPLQDPGVLDNLEDSNDLINAAKVFDRKCPENQLSHPQNLPPICANPVVVIS